MLKSKSDHIFLVLYIKHKYVSVLSIQVFKSEDLVASGTHPCIFPKTGADSYEDQTENYDKGEEVPKVEGMFSITVHC